MNCRPLKFIQMSLVVLSSSALSTSTRTTIRCNSNNCNINNRQVIVPGLRIKPNQHEPIASSGNKDSKNMDVLNEQLLEAFQKYGTVEKVVVHGLHEYLNKEKNIVKRPHAIVTFHTEQAAKSAVLDRTNTNLYRKIKSSTRIWQGNQKVKNNMSKQHEINELENDELVKSLISQQVSVDATLQVNKSHLHRVAEYIPEITHGAVKVVGIQESTPRKKLSLIFIKLLDDKMTCQQLVEDYLGNDVYLDKALNKFYDFSMKGTVMEGTESKICTKICEAIIAVQGQSDDQVIVKLEAFPLEVQRSVLDILEETMPKCIEIAPKGNTHILNIVRVDRPLSQRKRADSQGCYLWGISSAHDALIGSGGREIPGKETSEEKNFVSRAYYKLEEVFGRYKYQDVLSNFLEKKSCVAIDCGASPGGWTKYLIEKVSCSVVYSVDPGELSSEVTALPGVCYMPVKLEEALPQLVEQDVKIDIFVSDMCLHDMSAQVDFLLKACRPVLSDTVLFVLTLKCVIGHSKTSFDGQVKTQVERLESAASGVTVTHLLSNRRGERTVMGFLNS